MLLLATSLFFLPAYEITRSPERGFGLFTDSQGAAYVVTGSDADTTTKLTKFRPDGSLVYRVNAGSFGGLSATAFDAAGNLYFASDEGSPYLTKLTPDGQLVFHQALTVHVTAMALASDGSIYLTGFPASNAFRTTPGAFVPSDKALLPQDNPVAMKMTPDASRVIYSTFLDNSRTYSVNVSDSATAIAVDTAGYAFIAGETSDPGFPSTPGAAITQCCNGGATAFLLKLNPYGTGLKYSTFLPDGAYPTGLQVEPDGGTRLIVPSWLYSPSSISTMRVSPNGDQILDRVTTSLAAFGPTVAAATPDDKGNILVTGINKSVPVTPGAFRNGSNYVAVVRASDGTILYSSRLPNGAGGLAVAPDHNDGFIVMGTANGSPCDAFVNDPGVGLPCSVRGPVSMITRMSPTSAPKPAIFGITNVLGTNVSWGLAPGEIVSIYGAGLGPAVALSGAYHEGRLPFELGSTQVYFNGIAAPILLAQYNQINTVVPFQVAPGQSVNVQVHSNDGISNLATLPAIEQDSWIFGNLDQSGQEFAFAINEDGTVNSAAHPAKPNSVVTIFVNGAGRLTPEPLDGTQQPAGLIPASPVTVSLGGFSFPGASVPCEVLYAGAAPHQVAGKVQINFRLPPQPQPLPQYGPSAEIDVSIGSQRSIANIWRDR